MQSIIELMDAALPCPVYARGHPLGEECALYNFNTTQFNGSKREARMQVKIAARTMARVLELERLLDAALVPKGEEPLTATCTACARNGGGWLEDGDWHIRIAYYDMVFREQGIEGTGNSQQGTGE